LRLESAGTLFDAKTFESMLLLHKFYLYCDYICYVVLHFSTEKYKLFLRSPAFKDISQLTPVIFYLTYSDSHDTQYLGDGISYGSQSLSPQ
jgi:hypothetical protein